MPFGDCSFQLASDGGLSVYISVDNVDDEPEESIFCGYVNDSGELTTLSENSVEGDPGNVNKDIAGVLFLLGMK